MPDVTGPAAPSDPDLAMPFDVLIVGGGAAGIGMAIVLAQLGVPRFAVLERYEVGASFRRWPAEMRFITPSFPSNSFGALDLNSVAVGTSPGFSLDREHPSGREYAAYLERVASHFQLPVCTGIEVEAITPGAGRGFTLDTSEGRLTSTCVIWAGGEFQNPRTAPFPGAELCRHNSTVTAWADYPGDRVLVIGGYESGADAAVHLVAAGKDVLVLDAGKPWAVRTSDPSKAYSPFTYERLDAAHATGRLQLMGDARVVRVCRDERNGYLVTLEDGREFATPGPPVLATGFAQTACRHPELWDWRDDGFPELTAEDESTRAPGLFLIGPGVRQGSISFCFIYKFRQRFAVVAKAIGERLGLDVSPLDFFRAHGMFLEDLSCCSDECAC